MHPSPQGYPGITFISYELQGLSHRGKTRTDVVFKMLLAKLVGNGFRPFQAEVYTTILVPLSSNHPCHLVEDRTLSTIRNKRSEKKITFVCTQGNRQLHRPGRTNTPSLYQTSPSTQWWQVGDSPRSLRAHCSQIRCPIRIHPILVQGGGCCARSRNRRAF